MSTIVLTMALALSACSSQASRPSGAPVAVTIGDFHIRSSSATVGGGPVVFLVRDKGPSTHEFNVVRTDLPADQLPLRSDGLTVDEESPLMHFIGGIGELDVGDSEALALRLPPGRYVLFCNLEGHYLGGMHALLEVRRDATQP